ncbi:ankyrin [Pleomassaria siparia CBS 279.74]|uniref:Ankyrin n=1 Tax=Pleomassaria siparia CBS 279.74 TaxID=1314801 RepID=A0A6G1KC51_9PLEO|nr:ankyrin [Pleomassaria siparia CBS 279.74]
MLLLDFPTEILDEILHQAILARGVQRGLRLRLVNKLFSAEILRILYSWNYRLLDNYLAQHCLAPFAATYATARILNEPSNGYPLLLAVRRIAERIVDETSKTNDTRNQDVRACIHKLLERATACNSLWEIFDPMSAMLNEKEFSENLLAGAIYINSVPLVISFMEQGFRLCGRTILFGSPFDYISWHLEMAKVFPRKVRIGDALRSDSPLEVIQYICQRDMDKGGWTHPDNYKHWVDVFVTSSRLDVFDFMWNFRKSVGLPPSTNWTLHRRLLASCRLDSRIDMVERLLQITTLEWHKQGDWGRYDPLRVACKSGTTNTVQLLIDHGADPKITWPCECTAHLRGMITEAAMNQHWDTVRKLLDHGAEIIGPILGKAAKLGRLDIMQMLIDHGADPNAPCWTAEYKRTPHPLVTAILLERLDMFQFLLDRGAILSAEVGRDCAAQARSNGLESMLAFLERHGVNIEDKEVDSVGPAHVSSKVPRCG